MGGWGGIAGTVLGGAIGSLGGPAGMWKGAEIGGTLGTILDALTMKPPFRQGDSRWVGAPYGSPVPRVFNKFRVDAPVVWALRNTDGTYNFEHDTNGKKGPVTAHYWVSLLAKIAQTGFTYPDGTQSERAIVVDRILAADKVIYLNGVSYLAWVSGTTYESNDYVTGSDGKIYLSLADTNIGNDPTSQPSNWWALGQITTLNIQPVFHPDLATSESTFTQAADAFMVTQEGVGNVQAYRTYSTFLLENFDTFDIGNSPPSSLVVEGHTVTTYTLADILSFFCLECGLSSSDFDFSAAAGFAVEGFMALAQSSYQDLLNNLLSVYPVDVAQQDGIIKAIPRGGALAAVGVSGFISDDDLSAALNGEDLPARLGGTSLGDRSELHNQVRVGYRDSTSNFRQNYEVAHRNNCPSPNNLDITTDIVMTPDQAAQAAGRLLDTEWTERGGTWPIYLPGSYGGLTPADCVSLNDPLGNPQRYRITKKNWVQGRLQADLTRDEPENLVRYETGDGGQSPTTGNTKPVLTNFMICSPNVELSDSFAMYPGFYVFACKHLANGCGCTVYYTFDAPTAMTRNWVTGGTITQASYFGEPTNAIGASSAGYDGTHHTDVFKGTHQTSEATNMEFVDVSQTEAQNGQHWAFLCKDWSAQVWEVLAVVIHSALGPTESRMGPGLIRGLRNSDCGAANSNTLNEPAFMMSPSVGATTKIAVDPTYVGQTVYVRCVTSGLDVADSLTEQTCTIFEPIPPFSRNTGPSAPTSIAVSSPSYAGAAESLTFTPEFTTAPGPQTYNWEYSTDGGTTWSSAVNLPGSYVAPAFTSGTMMARCQAQTGDGRTSAWVDSANETYVAPASGSTSNFIENEVPSGTINGTNANFTLANTPLTGTLCLFVDGSRLGSADYTLSGANITVTNANYVPSSSILADYQH